MGPSESSRNRTIVASEKPHDVPNTRSAASVAISIATEGLPAKSIQRFATLSDGRATSAIVADSISSTGKRSVTTLVKKPGAASGS